MADIFSFMLAIGFLALPLVVPFALLLWTLDYVDFWKKKLFPKIVWIAVTAYLLAMSVFPFVVPEDILPFESAIITYAMVLGVVFALFIFAYNKR